MMPTWSEIKEEIKDEYDLHEETFIDDDELLAAANDAIRDLEKELNTIHDKYFHTEENIALVNGTATYDLPDDIFATKITGIYYNNGSDKYEIKEIKDLKQVMHIESDDYYGYRIINTSADGLKIKLYPASRETSSANVTIYYRRNVVLLADDADELDIPEGKNFVKQYVLDNAVNKERMTPDAAESPALKRERELFLASFENMIDDDNTEIGVDMCFYEEAV